VLDLSLLTAQQRQAVTAPDGPLVILAGPGSGKTTVLAGRIASLVLLRGVSPSTILALTFTRAAAGQLRHRLAGMLASQAAEVDVFTFHGLGLRMVRLWAEQLGYATDRLTVYGEHEQREEIKRLSAELLPAAELHQPDDVVRAVDQLRLEGELGSIDGLGALTAEYEAVLRRRAALDFTAMLALPLRLLEKNQRALQLYQDAYRHVLADEFQDVTHPQYRLLRQLAGLHRNLTVVGDPAQMLYSWRGAGPWVLDALRTDFSETRTLTLDENFRSTRRIVAIGNAVGQEVAGGRMLRTANPEGCAPVVLCADDERAEADLIAGHVRRLIQRDGLPPEQIAVLYRTNDQVDELALGLRRAGIAYEVRGKRPDLLARKEVQDLLAYVRLALNPGDVLALTRIVNVPPRGLARLEGQLRSEPVAIEELPAAAQPLGPRAVASAQRLVQVIADLHGQAACRPAELLDAVLAGTGYGEGLDGRGDELAAHGLVRLRRLLEDVDDLVTWLAEVQSGDAGLSGSPSVVLSTIHQAKGCEWRVVFIAGLEEGLLPHGRALLDPDQDKALAEEQRLAYVAVTRAREQLFLSYCRRRTSAGELADRRPSRFLRRLPGALLRAA